jgi:hypothetical protein
LGQIGKLIDFSLLILGPVLLVYAVISYFRTKRFVSNSVEVEGVVVRMERTYSGSRFATYDYAPVFSFTAGDGREYTLTSDIASSPPGFFVGEHIRVRYDPANPDKARIHTFFQTWGQTAISGLVGLGFLGVGLYQLGFLRIPH